ncbi:murein biosynthesis integral membrane protein MurJ [Candidatus Woesebacteria bacterium]|nr:murein biosynthesis integral membrane protein MurJ [Candidatus Woesebacteria bacterium]
MVRNILKSGHKFIIEPQNSILSAASVIMIMIIASRILGLVRQRTLTLFFPAGDLSLFFAAFRLPDLIFEVLVYGTFSSAFIPVFSKALKKGDSVAWEVAGRVVNIGLLIFGMFAIVFSIFAPSIYSLLAPGYSVSETKEIANLARLLFAAQGFFIVSYVLTGVLESLRRFFLPALAPIFYNLGIIFGTIALSPHFGLFGPAIGVVIGAFAHLFIQLPLALKLGFRFTSIISPNDEVKEIGRLSLPRFADLSVEQIEKTAELFLASLISRGSYTYFTLATSLQILPVNLFGTSLAKAALPMLSQVSDSPERFRKILFTTLNHIIFLVMPLVAVFVVLRIPIIRIAFGSKKFDWASTVETSVVLTAFSLGIVFQAASAILERGFYALHDTKTPVKISIVTISLMVIIDFILVRGFGLPVWALAASFSVGVMIQSIALFYLLNKKIGQDSVLTMLKPSFKSGISSVGAGFVMFFLLKFFDRSVWIKKLSFLGLFGSPSTLPFESFVLDTRYTVNLLILSVLVSLVGLLVYVLICIILRSEEVWYFIKVVKRIISKPISTSILPAEKESVSPPIEDNSAT